MARLPEILRSRPWPQREALVLFAALIVGLILLPPAVYYTGHEMLGPYARGGLPQFWGDYLAGLVHGSLPGWLLALGPYACVMFGRGARLAWRLGARV
jgi:hypothetical protein